MSKKNKNKNGNSMPSDGVIRLSKGIPGVMSCIFTHKTKETQHDFEWLGQPLNSIWPEVLAFLKWTNDEFHSESQLRLFVNQRTKEWKAWAFPQRARTSMSAKEITEGEEGYDKTKEQRAQFGDDWYYWGTVHHHCSCSAFQSGTDRENEQNQDGIHITVGNMNSQPFDIHFRVYVGGFSLTGIELSEFWDVGDEMNKLPDNFRAMLVNNAEDILIRRQMGTLTKDAKFPDVWRQNIIEIKPQPVTTLVAQGTFYGPQSHGSVMIRTFTERSKQNYKIDLSRACQALDLINIGRLNHLPDMIKALEWAATNLSDDMLNLLGVCYQHDVTPGNLAHYLIQEAINTQKRLQPHNHGQVTKQQVLGAGSVIANEVDMADPWSHVMGD